MSQIAAEQQAVVSSVVETHPEKFQTQDILTIVSGHFVHDVFTAFLPSLLPELIKKLSLTLTQAGSLTVFLQLPGLLNLFIGYLADRISVRYFVIFAPAVTATLIGLTGFAPSYAALALLLFVAGVSVAAFHAPAPAMIGQVSGRRVGLGMSLFMAGGELARAVGPLLIVAALAQWGLNGFWRLSVLGWAASGILYWRLHDVSAQTKPKRGISLRESLPQLRRLFAPLAGVLLLRDGVIAALAVYLVVLLEKEGYTLAQASSALAIYEFAGFFGALTGGTLSDRLGRKPTMGLAIGSAALLLLVFLNVSGWVLIPVLILLGFTALSVTPVIQAMVQEQFPDQRATANGLFMLLTFLIRSLTTLVIGFMGDTIGLRPAFMVCAVIALAAVPFIFALPSKSGTQAS